MILLLAATVLTDKDDLELFYELYEKYKVKMFNCAYGVLRDRQLAEDAVSEAFVGVLRNFNTVKTLCGSKLDSYFIKSARNAAFDCYRKCKVRWENEISFDDRPELSESWDSTFSSVERVIDASAVVEALNRIPPHFRNVLQICIVEGYSVAEAARVLGCPRTTVEYRLQRGKERFAKEYLKITGEE